MSRVDFGNVILGIINGDRDDLNLALMSYEAHFHVPDVVNKPNMRYWAPVNPTELHKQPLHLPEVTVWCTVKPFGMGGPFFFEN